MTPLRTFCMFAVILCAATCAAQPSVPPDQAKLREKAPPYVDWRKERRMPLFLDFGYEWRSHGEYVAWNTGFLHIRPRLGDIFKERPLDLQSFGFLARFERAYLVSPNPARWFIGASYTFGADYNLGSAGGQPSGPLATAFPTSRSSVFSLSTTTVLGYLHSEATQHARHGDGVSTMDALRLEHWDQVGVLALRLEVGGALNFNLRGNPRFEWEAFVRMVLGRPILPFGIAIGYRYMALERGGGGFFVLGVVVAF